MLVVLSCGPLMKNRGVIKYPQGNNYLDGVTGQFYQVTVIPLNFTYSNLHVQAGFLHAWRSAAHVYQWQLVAGMVGVVSR